MRYVEGIEEAVSRVIAVSAKASLYLGCDIGNADAFQKAVRAWLVSDENAILACLEIDVITKEEARNLLMAKVETYLKETNARRRLDEPLLVHANLEDDFSTALFGPGQIG